MSGPACAYLNNYRGPEVNDWANIQWPQGLESLASVGMEQVTSWRSSYYFLIATWSNPFVFKNTTSLQLHYILSHFLLQPSYNKGGPVIHKLLQPSLSLSLWGFLELSFPPSWWDRTIVLCANSQKTTIGALPKLINASIKTGGEIWKHTKSEWK